MLFWKELNGVRTYKEGIEAKVVMKDVNEAILVQDEKLLNKTRVL